MKRTLQGMVQMIIVFMILLGGYLMGNYTAAAIVGTVVLGLATYFVCGAFEPSDEELQDRKETREFQERSTMEIRTSVYNLIRAHPELDPKKLGLKEDFPLEALWAAWHFLWTLSYNSAIVFYNTTDYRAKKMELLDDNSLVVYYDEGHRYIPEETVIGEIIASLSSHSKEPTVECPKVLNWLRVAMSVKKELCDLTVRLENRSQLWQVDQSASDHDSNKEDSE